MINAQVFFRVAHMQYALATMLALALDQLIVFLLVEVRDQMVVEVGDDCVLHLVAVWQLQCFQTIRAKVIQRIYMFL
jgi:hypothetical protein